MHKVKRHWGLLMVSVAALGSCLVARAAISATLPPITTEQSGTMIVFPKVIWDGTTDTIIQITNTGNSIARARCYYIDASQGQCSETDFDIFLTKRQPTIWAVSQGRGRLDEGFSPGLVPAMPEGFKGELKCIQVSESGEMQPSNSLKGEATLRTDNGDVGEYNAIAFRGGDTVPSGDNGSTLALSATGDLSRCPSTVILNHFEDGVADPVMDEFGQCDSRTGCAVRTELTLVPCSEDLENQIPGNVTVQVRVFDEFETSQSGSFPVQCWVSDLLTRTGTSFGGAFQQGVLGVTRQARLTVVGTCKNSGGSCTADGGCPSGDTCLTEGVIGVAEEFRAGGARAAFNLHTIDDAGTAGADKLVLPAH